MVEAGEADVVVVAFFDRLVRSLAVQAEVVARVEAAGGAILARRRRRGRAPTRPASGCRRTMLGAVAEYDRRATAERTADAKRRAVARGVPPFPNVPPGYRKREDGRLEPHPEQAPIVAEAFQLRAGGATIMDVREYLREHGIERSFHGVQALLASRHRPRRAHFGALVNATRTRRSSTRDVASASSGAPAARPSPEVRSAARPPRRPPLRHLRRADGRRVDDRAASATRSTAARRSATARGA